MQKMFDLTIRWGFYLLFFLVPLVLTPWNYELFEYNKMMVTYALTIIIVGAWIGKMLVNKKLSIASTPLDIPIGLFVLSQGISAIFSIDSHVSWFGYYSRFNGGMWSVISYVLLYYAFVTNIRTDTKSIPRALTIMVSSAFLVSLYGLLERMGIDKHLWVQDVQSRVFSTLGQPNWLAAYLVAIMPIVFTLMIQHSIDFRKRISNNELRITKQVMIFSLFVILHSLFFFVLLSTRSRAGLVGFAVSDVLFWFLTFRTIQNKRHTAIPFFIVHVVCALIIFFNGSYISQIDTYFTLGGITKRITHERLPPQPVIPTQPTGTLLEFGGTESGTIRKYVWQAAITAWRSSTKTFLIGTGTETFAWTFFKFRPVEHNLTSEWDFLYNKAHNEYLNYLATTGIFGLGSYLLLISTFSIWIVRLGVKASKSTTSSETLTPDAMMLVCSALFSGWISILVTNFFGFSVVVIQTFLFLFPAIIITLLSPHDSKRSNLDYSIPRVMRMPAHILVSIITCVLLFGLIRHWWADTLFAKGYRLNRSGLFAQAKPLLAESVRLNATEPLYKDELSSALASLTIPTVETDASEAAQMAKDSIASNNTAITISPNNVNYWKTRTKIFYTLSSFDPNLNQNAVDSLNKALELSPNDPKIYYNLAILYGRQNESEKALELLRTAKKLKPNYRDAYFGLYVFYTDLGKKDRAKEELTEYLRTVDPNDSEFIEKLKL